MDTTKLAKFLAKIKMIESSNGMNLNHKTMQSGIHKGKSAYGEYGLMPDTIQEVVNRARINSQGNLSPEYQQIYKQDPDTVKAILQQNPEIEQQLARDLALRLLKRMPDEDRAAYGWNMGHNTDPEVITDEKLDTNPYVQKYRALQNLGVK